MIHHFSALDSTNTMAVQMAEQGAEHGTIIHADRQTGGRGRAGRSFISPVGGLYFSLILRPKLDVTDIPLIPLAGGVGICEGLAAAVDVDTSLKWPNDLYLMDKKLGGILTESGRFLPGTGPEYIVIGVGVNVQTSLDQFPSSLRGRVISLYHQNGSGAGADALVQPLADGILSAVRRLADNREQLLDHWRKRDYLMNRELAYAGTGSIVRATGKGLASDGRYRVMDASGIEHRVTAGDINPVRLLSH